MILNAISHNIQDYADDLTLLSLSIYAMQLLIDKLCPLLEDLSLTINDKKSVCMIFKPRHTEEISSFSFK